MQAKTKTAIETIEDLVRVLDEHPQWLEALRVRLLTRELIELPQNFASFVDATNKRFDTVDQRFDTVDQRFDTVDQRFDTVDQRFDTVDQRFDTVDQRFDTVDRRFDTVNRRLGKVESDIQALRNDIAPLKGAHARNAALLEADLIAEGMGFSFVRVLPQDEIRALVQSQDTTEIPANELKSFRRADLIVEAADQAGEPCYITAEISFTANGRDTARAVRNAGFLTRFTGRPAHAAIVGLHMDDRIRDSIASGAVSWHRLDPKNLEVE